MVYTIGISEYTEQYEIKLLVSSKYMYLLPINLVAKLIYLVVKIGGHTPTLHAVMSDIWPNKIPYGQYIINIINPRHY